MASKNTTKLEPASLKYPDGGGMKVLRATSNNIKAAEQQLMEARHNLERLKLKERHTQSKTSKKAK